MEREVKIATLPLQLNQSQDLDGVSLLHFR